jgi:hypothetical protein
MKKPKPVPAWKKKRDKERRIVAGGLSYAARHSLFITGLLKPAKPKEKPDE